MRQKAILAAVFAASMLGAPCTSVVESKELTQDSVVYKIAIEMPASSEIRAHYLLSLTYRLLDGGKKSEVEKDFFAVAKDRNVSRDFIHQDRMLTPWAERTLAQEGAGTVCKLKSGTVEHTLAVSAVSESIRLLSQSTDEFAKLNLYLIAGSMAKKLGDTADAKVCEKVLESAIKSCEDGTRRTPEHAKNVIAVLNAMSCAYVMVPIADYPAPQKKEPIVCTEAQFEQGEKLRRRALAIADKLPETEHVRRKAHRDMALWYAALGKQSLANHQKQELFKMIGSSDDKLLYPQSAGCSSTTWWEVKTIVHAYDCGMG
ncbi:MAG: hypothetical protein QG625_59 [Cyanobacteriota bacterium erpe_2018_sw_39hr_WHONDRS-SW48-000098_B_bin.30]|jgi:hypothetical protein|nr:hypothetical protein [Cyanobacteriota bacterium erpe_2018_sw_39hr_WHONDRS-SW48-000098_B_bin.30]